MSTPPNDPMQDLALALYYRVAELMKNGKTRDQIITELGLQGVNRETVEMMLGRLKQSQRNVEKRRGRLNVVVGLVLIGIAGGMIFGWFGIPLANSLAVIPAYVALAIGGYWLVRGVFQVMGL